MWRIVSILAFGLWWQIGFSQPAPTSAPPDAVQQRLKSLEEALSFMKHDLAKVAADTQWFQRLADIAEVDKVRFTGPPPRTTNNPTAQDAGLEVIVSAYTFIPNAPVQTRSSLSSSSSMAACMAT